MTAPAPAPAHRRLAVSLACALACALPACGGGGGSSANSGASTPEVLAADPVVTPDASAFTALQNARSGAGAGALVRSTALDVAAVAHAAYLQANIAAGLSHSEDPARTAFYAATPPARLAKAGFASSFSTEVIATTGVAGPGADCVMALLDTVYHGVALLSRATHVGIGFGVDAAGLPLCVADLATAAGDADGQMPAAGALVAYPYPGQSAVRETFAVAFEQPRPSAVLFPNATTGTPVIVGLRNADYRAFEAAGTLDVVVTAFALQDAAGHAVPAGLLAPPAFRAGPGVALNADAQLFAGFAVLVPFSPLARGQTYTASVSATLKTGAAPLARTWSFTTRP